MVGLGDGFCWCRSSPPWSGSLKWRQHSLGAKATTVPVLTSIGDVPNWVTKTSVCAPARTDQIRLTSAWRNRPTDAADRGHKQLMSWYVRVVKNEAGTAWKLRKSAEFLTPRSSVIDLGNLSSENDAGWNLFCSRCRGWSVHSLSNAPWLNNRHSQFDVKNGQP